jgi:hypothetical protein
MPGGEKSQASRLDTKLELDAQKALSPNKLKSNAMGSYKYGVYVPNSMKDALANDEYNQDNQ